MKTSNHPYQKIIQSRGLILRISYIIAISLIILAFKWETSYSPNEIDQNITEVEIIEIIPRSIQKEEVVVPKAEPAKQPVLIEPVSDIKIVDNNKKVEQTTAINMEDLTKNPVELTETVEMPVEPYRFVEQMPEFPGGLEAFYKYFQKNYKSKTCTFGAEGGKIHVEFVINEIGKPTDVKILKGICGNIDNEVMRVIESMPAWQPGKQRGKNVKVYYNLPVQIVLRK